MKEWTGSEETGRSERMDVWFHTFCPEELIEEVSEGFSVEILSTSLMKSNIHLVPFQTLRPCGPGIIMLTEITSHVCDFVRTVSREQHERVLVLCPRRTNLAFSNPWDILRAGATDFLVWDSLSDLAPIITAKFRRWREVDDLANSSLVQTRLVGQSHAWKTVVRRIVEIGRFTDDPIVFVGETGTGKDLAAHLCHELDLKHCKHELSILDCTTIVPDLSGSELFGHEKGAFTGAVSARDGAFALADGGTLFLDEVGELPMGLQIQLLRVLQEHTYKRIGSNLWHKTDFRLVCATNRELGVDQAQGNFRKDLYYRIAHWVIQMPALRERLEDIILLVRHFMQQAQPEREPPEIDEKVQEYFLTREYPGNVRDLRNLVNRIMARHVGPGPITIGDIPNDERPLEKPGKLSWCDSSAEQSIRRALASGMGLREIKDALEETVIAIVLEDESGNLQRASRVLGVTDRTLQKRRADQTRHIEAMAGQTYLNSLTVENKPRP
jgi:DNA-binding NtrC family response regulator